MSEKGIKRMSASQFRTAKALIQDLCCNYDKATKKCIVRDDFIECPQMMIQSVCCSWFRDALLEDKDGQLLKAQLYQADHVRRCEVCGQPFRALSNRAKYCARCSIEMQKKQARNRKRKERGIDVTL